MAERPLYTLYKNLKAQNFDVPDDYNKFESALTRDGKAGADNRHALYENTKAQNFDVPDTYERFYSALFEPRSKNSSRARGGDVPLSQEEKNRMYLNAGAIRMGGAGMDYTKLKQRKQRQRKDFGRVSIGTHQTPYGGDANNVIKDDATGQYVTSDNQQTGNVAEAQERQAVLDEQNNAYQEAVNAGDIPSVFDVRDKNGNYDLQENIGKNGTYLTEEGAQNQLDKKLADAYARKKEIENAIAEDNQKNGNPLLSYSASLGGGNGRDAASSDYRNKLATSLALVTQQIGALEAVKQYPTSSWGEDAWKALDNTAFTAKTWDFGLTDFATMGQMERIKTKMDNGVPLSGSDKMLLKSKVGADAAAALEDEKMGNIYRWTKIAGQSLPFMADFFLTGGYGGITKGISRGALKIAAKRGMGKVSAAILKNTGIVMGDVIGSYAMAGTEQAMKTGADIMQRHMGNLYLDENGNYAFGTFDENGNLLHEGGETIGKALYKGLTSAMVENYTEKLFGHNYGIKKGALNFMEKHGMSRAADFFKNIGQSGWYAGSKKWMEKFGINGFAEEVMEEEIGIPLHALLDGEGKVSDLLDPKQQLDIIGGMAISVGSMYAMGIGTKPIKGAYNRAQYYRFKHKVDLTDSEAQQLLGDNWEQLKEQMDNATNDKMGGVLYNILQQRDKMSKEQINAAILYGVNLMKMRGYNLTKTAEMNAKEITNEPTTPEEERQEQIDNAYAEGHEAEAEDTHEIQIDQADKQRSLAALLGISEQQLSAMSNEELDALTGQNDNLDRAIYEYQLSNAKYQGVMDNAQDQVDLAAQRAASMTDMITDQTRGTVRNATIKGTQGANDYGVYIINGNLATHDDGAINISGSDQMIIYYDPTTGKVEHADASRFAALGDENPAEDVKAQAVADAKEKAIKETSGIIDGRVEVGSQFTITDADGTQHEYEVLADNGDGTAMITLDGNIPTEIVKGETVQIPYSFEDLQTLKDAEDQKWLEVAKQQRAEMEAQREQQVAEQQKQEEDKQEQQNQVLADLIDDNGNVKIASVEGNEDADAFIVGEYNNKKTGVKKYKVVTLNSDGSVSKPRLVDSSKVSIIDTMSADEYKHTLNIPDSSTIEGNSGEEIDNKETLKPSDETDIAPEHKEEETTEEQNESAAESSAVTLEDGTVVPFLEDGNPDFSQLTAAQTAELYDEQFGEDADGVIGGWVNGAKKALGKAINMTINGKNFLEQKASKEAKEKAIADAQAAYDSAVAIRDAYNERQLAKEENTPEGRRNLIDKARRKYNRLKGAVKDNSETLSQLYSDTIGSILHRLYDGTGIDVMDTAPMTAEEYVASNLAPYSLNYEGNENSKGVRQETGLSRSDFAKTQLLATDGKGTTIDALVHSLWDNRPSNLDSLDTQEIRNALLNVITSGFKASDARDYVQNLRIGEAEKILEEQQRAADNAKFAEEQKATEEEQTTENANESEAVPSEEKKFPDKLRESKQEETTEVPDDATDEKPLGEQKGADEVPFSPKDNGEQETIEERAANVEKNKVDDTDVVDAIIGKKTRKALDRIAKMMGAKIQYQYTDKLGNGWYDADTNTIYLTLDSSLTEGVQFIFGHEMTHEIKTKNAEAYEELSQLVKNSVTDFDKAVDAMQKRYSDAGLSGYDRAYYEEETVADGIGCMMRDLNYAHTLALKMSHPLLAKIHEIINRIRMAFHGTEYTETAKNIMRSIEQAYVSTANREAENAAIQEGEEGQRLSLRTKEAPKKTQKVYKLMRLNPAEEGKLFPLFIGNGEAVELGKWYDADSPKLQDLKNLSSKDYVATRSVTKGGKKVKENYNYGAYIVNNETGEAMSLADFKEKYAKEFAKMGNNPNVVALNWATDNGYRWIRIEEKNQGQSRYGGEKRSYYNYGINGTGAVSTFAMRPGWHAGSLPTMRQIGKGKGKNLRDDNFVWVEGEIPADIDYNEEAQKNADKDIPDHIPTDGYYLKATNGNKEASQADKVGWYVAGAFKANRIMSDKETRDIIDQWNNEHPDEKVEYDWKRESGKDFNAETMRLEDTPKFSIRVYHGSGADFSEFDFDHMGEGAGSQAFGWGGYVTSSKEIGKDYASVGQQSAQTRRIGKDKTPLESAVSSILGQEMYNGTQANTFEKQKAQAIKNSEDLIASYGDMLKDSDELDDKGKNFLKKSIESAKQELKVLRPMTEKQYQEERIKQGKTKNLYEVNIPDDNGSNYLDWDAKAPKGLLDKIKKDFKISDSDAEHVMSQYENKGEGLYRLLSMFSGNTRLGSAKDASSYLSKEGIVGIKYYAGRNFGGANYGDTNYVIFKPEDMKIAEHTKFSIRTYHGSQASFDHFDHSFMGSGEGAQAYGWGTYVSEVEGIAKAYAKANSAKRNTEYSTASFEYDTAKSTYEFAKGTYDFRLQDIDKLNNTLKWAKGQLAKAKENNRKNWIEEFEARVADTERALEENQEKLQQEKTEMDNAKKEMDEAKKKLDAIPDPERNLYTVEIPDDTGDNYLGWDKVYRNDELYSMLDKIGKALEAKGLDLDKEYNQSASWNDWIDRLHEEAESWEPNVATGREIYNKLSGMLGDNAYQGNQKAASLVLKDAGFDGVKVIAQRNTGGNKEGKMNYVIFDENNAKITDHTKFSLKDNANKDFATRLKSAISDTEINPSDAQKESGNYKKGHIKFGGYDYTIENPKGSVRSGKDGDGKEWKVTMHDTYGYIRGKWGKDGDHLDMFINDNADLDNWNGDVYVVDQVNPDGSFDEHKVMYGYESMDDAKKAYLSNYSEGWQGLGNITGASKDEFDKWLDTSKRKLKPFADYAKVKFSQAQSVEVDNNPMFSAIHTLYTKGKEFASKLFNMKYFDVVKTPDFMKSIGLTGDKFTVRYGVMSRHFGKDGSHNFTEEEWRQLPNAIKNPFAISKLTDKKDGYRLYTTLKTGKGEYVVVGADVKNAGRNLEVNSIATIFGRRNDANLPMNEEVIYKSEKITPEQMALLSQPNSDQYPSNQELSAAKIDNSSETTKKNGEKFSLKDEEYLKAVKDGDMEKAQQMVNEAAEAAGYSTGSDYQGTSAFNGSAPWGNAYFLTKEERKEAWDNDEYDGEQTLGDYIHRGIDAMNLDFIALDPRNYRSADVCRKEAISNVRNAINKKSKTITMYRSVPADVKESTFRNGDWVTPSRGYAVDNAKVHGWGDDYNIIEQKVPVDEIWWDGNDIAEWGYGREEDYVNDTDFAYKNTKNNRKLLDAVTYDDNGNVIPLSQRFNEKNKDVRYSLKDEKTLAGVHNITEDKLRKALKLGGLANPSLAVIDTSKTGHSKFGEISFIAPSALVDKRTGNTAGTWTTDAYTQRYPSVERQMTEKGYDNFKKWVDGLDYSSADKSEILRQTKDVLEDNGVPAWELMYLKEKGIDLKGYDSDVDYRWQEIISNHPTAKDILDAMKSDPDLNDKVTKLAKSDIVMPTWSDISKKVRKQIYKETGVKVAPINPKVRAKVKEIFERDYAPQLLDKDGSPKKADVKKIVEDMVKRYNDTKKYSFYKSKVKASSYVNKNGLYPDYIRWQENKLDEFGTKNRIFRGYKNDGTRKYVPETLENVSKAMKEEANGQTNGGEYTSFGSFIAKLADRVDSTEEMRANKDKLSSNEDKEAFYNKWEEVYYDLAKSLYNDVMYGEERLHDIVLQPDPKKYAKKEYGITLTPSFMKKLDALKKAVKEELKSGYFETKFDRPVRLNEFVAAIVPNDLGDDVRKGLEKAGLSLYDYNPNEESDRQRAFDEAVNSSDNIRFSLKQEKEKIVEDAKKNGSYMLAPNGEKSKLDAEQWVNVRTNNFKKWFGDWENDHEKASKVVDENGEPMVVYHGRSTDFNTFEKKEGVRFVMGLEDKVKAEGFFFSPDKGLAEEFAGNAARHRGGKANIVPCFLNIRKPLDLVSEGYDNRYEDVTGWSWVVGMDNQDNLWEIMDEEGMADKMKNKGYDGAIFVEEVDDNYEPTKISYCALDANQIKSADNNNGEYSAENNDIRFSLRVDQYEHDLEQWKRDNNLPKDAVRPSIPMREPNESAVGFMKRVKEYRQQMALWKTAPQLESHLMTSDTAQGQFNLELQKRSVLARIALQDSMLPIRKAQEAIMREAGVDRLNIAEDAYTAENRSHGKGKNELEEYNDEFLQPLRKAYNEMKKVLGNSYDNVKVYMIAKHGLERNAHIAFKKALDKDFEKQEERIKAYKAYKADMDRLINDADFVGGKIDFTTWRQRDNAIRTKYAPSFLDFRYDKMGIAFDYSGLSALFDGADFEEAAAELVKDIEDKHGHETGVLWYNTNQATKKILRDSYKAGMMSKEVYEYVRGMYENYIPLRGWGDTNADQVWNYMGGGKGVFNQTLKEAQGRSSLADDPIAYIENMAESGILVNNKNWVKRHLLLLAQNHHTSLLNVSRAWYIKTADANGNEEWIPASPNITANMTSKQVEAELDAFQKKMETLEQKGDATQKREHLEISYPQTNSEEREHEVRVMKDGEEYVIYVNGDPQLAQAMNNTRARRVRQGMEENLVLRNIEKLGRKMAAAYTSLSPLFIPSNFMRDTTMTLASTAIREDARYNYLLRKNMLTHWNTMPLVVRYQNGTLREKVRDGKASKTEQMFYDFMMNGGETGFVSSLDVEDLKKKFKNELKDMNRMAANPKKVGHIIMNSIETLNRAIEDSNRFMVYMTSIQYGRSIDEAVNDAKDVTLNFNRKGTGEHGWQWVRSAFLFINPAIQSLQTLGALAKHHPFRFTAVTTAWLASGMLVPMVNYMLMSMLGGDDDKDKYWSFTKWDRRNNFIMWVPFTHNFVKIPLAQEFRGFYGVGDMIASKLLGGEKAEESWEDYGWDMLGQVVDMLPLDPTGYDGNIAVSLMPNAIRPILELAFNVDFTGKPLFKDSEYNKYDPNFTKAYVGTPDWLVRISRKVNSIGNDYPDFQQNFIDKIGNPRFNLNNPAVLDHVLSSYLGGAYTMGSQVLGLLTKALNGDEVKMADVPLVSKFVGNPDDRPASKKQGDEFWTMKERHDRAANTLSKLKKKAKVDGDYSTLDVFFDSDEYKQYKVDDAKVKKYEEEKKKERAEESGDDYQPKELTADAVYALHATPKDDFEDLKESQIYPKVNGIKKSWEALLDMASSQKDSFYNENADAIQAADKVATIREQINEIKKDFLSEDGKEAYSAEGMNKIRQLRKKALGILEEANKVIVAKQKAKAEANKKK